MLGSEVVLADETQWPLLDKPGSTKCFAWSAASEKGVAYRILKSRSAEAARRVLDGFTGILVTDGYAAYQAMRDTLGRERAGPVVLAHCWAHVRRKFHDAEPAWPEAGEMLDRRGKLKRRCAQPSIGAMNCTWQFCSFDLGRYGTDDAEGGGVSSLVSGISGNIRSAGAKSSS